VRIDVGQLRFVGRDLKRPECVLCDNVPNLSLFRD
jgi:hypothetical protein